MLPAGRVGRAALENAVAESGNDVGRPRTSECSVIAIGTRWRDALMAAGTPWRRRGRDGRYDDLMCWR